MLGGRRDYILSIIEQIAQLLAQVVFNRQAGRPQAALQTIMQACERLFGMEGAQLFQFTPDQHFAMLVENEAPENARAKVLIYAALNVEAAHVYTAMGKPEVARLSLTNALRLTLRARQTYGAAELPAFAPDVNELLAALKDAPLDADTAELLQAANSG